MPHQEGTGRQMLALRCSQPERSKNCHSIAPVGDR